MTSSRTPTKSTPIRPVTVVGSGMSGLLSAYYLLEAGFKVEVHEALNTVGGKLQTRQEALGLRELAANAMIADIEVEAVCKKIGVQLIEKEKGAQRRWIFRKKLRQWPMGFSGSLSIAKFLISLRLNRKGMAPRPYETLKVWSERTLGEEVTQFLLSPACLGIFGVEADKLSATLVFNYFFPAEKPPRGNLRGSVAPEGGMQEFALKMRSYLESKGVRFYMNTFRNSKNEERVVLATDMPSAVDFLKNSGDSRAKTLSNLPQVDLYSVNMFYEKPLPEQQRGFGVLFPRGENIVPLGVLLNSFIFSRKEKGFSETWIFGDVHPSGMEKWSGMNFLTLLNETKMRVWGKAPQHQEIFINPWPQALPLYGIELEKALESLPLYSNGLYLVGNYLGEIGLNRLFHRAKKMSEELKKAP